MVMLYSVQRWKVGSSLPEDTCHLPPFFLSRFIINLCCWSSGAAPLVIEHQGKPNHWSQLNTCRGTKKGHKAECLSAMSCSRSVFFQVNLIKRLLHPPTPTHSHGSCFPLYNEILAAIEACVGITVSYSGTKN